MSLFDIFSNFFSNLGGDKKSPDEQLAEAMRGLEEAIDAYVASKTANINNISVNIAALNKVIDQTDANITKLAKALVSANRDTNANRRRDLCKAFIEYYKDRSENYPTFNAIIEKLIRDKIIKDLDDGGWLHSNTLNNKGDNNGPSVLEAANEALATKTAAQAPAGQAVTKPATDGPAAKPSVDVIQPMAGGLVVASNQQAAAATTKPAAAAQTTVTAKPAAAPTTVAAPAAQAAAAPLQPPPPAVVPKTAKSVVTMAASSSANMLGPRTLETPGGDTAPPPKSPLPATAQANAKAAKAAAADQSPMLLTLTFNASPVNQPSANSAKAPDNGDGTVPDPAPDSASPKPPAAATTLPVNHLSVEGHLTAIQGGLQKLDLHRVTKCSYELESQSLVVTENSKETVRFDVQVQSNGDSTLTVTASGNPPDVQKMIEGLKADILAVAEAEHPGKANDFLHEISEQHTMNLSGFDNDSLKSFFKQYAESFDSSDQYQGHIPIAGLNDAGKAVLKEVCNEFCNEDATRHLGVSLAMDFGIQTDEWGNETAKATVNSLRDPGMTYKTTRNAEIGGALVNKTTMKAR